MPSKKESEEGLGFWKAAEFLRAKGAEHMGESMLSFGRSGRFKKGGCRWSIAQHITVSADGDTGSRINISQDSILGRNLAVADPLGKERKCAQEIARTLMRHGYDGEILENPPPLPEDTYRDIELKVRRFSGRFDKPIKTVEGLAAEYERFISPNLAATFGLVPDGELDTVTTIQRVVANRFAVQWEDLRSNKRHSSLELPRQLAMYLSIESAMKNAIEVAEFFGAANQMDVIRARKKIRQLLASDSSFARKVKAISRQVEKIASPS